ncbi:MAG TPA: phage portal protein [Rhizomicrobium sp.]|nr:phage portal protein [Rhizomicrobium sp.]
MFENFFRPASVRASDGAQSHAIQAPEIKTMSPFVALTLPGRAPSWSPRDYQTLAREGMMANAIAYRCVRMIAEAAASVPWLLYEGAVEIETHPLLTLLTAPNTMESGAVLFERWYAFLQCAGDSYLQAVTIDGAVRELFVLRPDRVTVVQDATGWPRAFEYKVNNTTMRIARDANGFLPILHARLFHPLDDTYGFSPIAAAGSAVEIHNAGAAWTKSLLDNAARPSGALIYKGPDGAPGLTADQFARLKSELENAYAGATNAGKPMVLEGGLDWRAMSYTPSDMDFSDIRNSAAREIALAFGIPPMLLGIPGDNTYANYREANLAFWRQTVLPLVSRTAQSLTRWLAPRFGENLRLDFDIDEIDALTQDRESTWDKLEAASFLTVNEKRAAAGYGPVEGGDGLQPGNI